MESNIWKTCGEKNLKFFVSRLEFLCFNMLKNKGRGLNRLGVKKSFVTQIVRYRSKTIKLKNVVFELKKKKKQDLNAFARKSGRYCCFLVFPQMTLIWFFKVTKVQTVNTIRFATYHFLYVFHSNYSAISRETLFFSI